MGPLLPLGRTRRPTAGTDHVIRNVVVVRLKPSCDSAVVDGLLARFRTLNCPGTLAYTVGTDAGLRGTDNWSFAIVADFADVESYRAYDLDEKHNRVRADLGALTDEVARVQFEL